MPRPSPRKLSNVIDIGNSPDGKRISLVNGELVEEEELKVQKRRINKKMLAEI